jgi:hypothetical protein
VRPVTLPLVSLLTELDALYTEHRGGGELQAAPLTFRLAPRAGCGGRSHAAGLHRFRPDVSRRSGPCAATAIGSANPSSWTSLTALTSCFTRRLAANGLECLGASRRERLRRLRSEGGGERVPRRPNASVAQSQRPWMDGQRGSLEAGMAILTSVPDDSPARPAAAAGRRDRAGVRIEQLRRPAPNNAADG